MLSAAHAISANRLGPGIRTPDFYRTSRDRATSGVHMRA
jgi:hypothetical protein